MVKVKAGEFGSDVFDGISFNHPMVKVKVGSCPYIIKEKGFQPPYGES